MEKEKIFPLFFQMYNKCVISHLILSLKVHVILENTTENYL